MLRCFRFWSHIHNTCHSHVKRYKFDSFGSEELFLLFDITKHTHIWVVVVADEIRFQANKNEVSLAGMTLADFQSACILSGCDYLPNIAGQKPT